MGYLRHETKSKSKIHPCFLHAVMVWTRNVPRSHTLKICSPMQEVRLWRGDGSWGFWLFKNVFISSQLHTYVIYFVIVPHLFSHPFPLPLSKRPPSAFMTFCIYMYVAHYIYLTFSAWAWAKGCYLSKDNFPMVTPLRNMTVLVAFLLLWIRQLIKEMMSFGVHSSRVLVHDPCGGELAAGMALKQ